MDKQTLLDRLAACERELRAHTEQHGRGTEYWHYWNDRAQLVRGWLADVSHDFREDYDTIAYELEEFERMVARR